ncbi:Protein transport protein S9 plasma membrane t-SNARE [Dimargaris xerosporica]|nr:Protein transport protein S9 plasma membrane t-SNARE [Dimargaris xerosporica]
MDDYRRYRNSSASSGPSAAGSGSPWQPRSGYGGGGPGGAHGASGYGSGPSSTRNGPGSGYGSPHGSSGCGSSNGSSYRHPSSHGHGPQHQHHPSASPHGAPGSYRSPPGHGDPALVEQDEYDHVRGQIRTMKQDTLASSRNALKTLRETEQVGATTLKTLGDQTMQLSSVNQQLTIADLQTDVSLDKTAELKQLNRNFLVPTFGNPFGRKKRKEQELQRQVALHEKGIHAKEQDKRLEAQDRGRLFQMGWRESTPEPDDGKGPKGGKGSSGGSTATGSSYAAMSSSPSAAVDGSPYGVGQSPYASRSSGYRGPPLSAEERARYTLKQDPHLERTASDNEDDELEDELHQNTHEMLGAISNLKKMGLNMQSELTIQNKRLDGMANQSDKVAGKIFTSQYRVDKM